MNPVKICGPKNFSMLAKRGLAIFEFLKRGCVYFFRGGGFCESNFQLLIKYHIRLKKCKL